MRVAAWHSSLGLAGADIAGRRSVVGMRQRLAYLACSLGIGVFSGFNTFTLPLWLSTFTTSYLLLGLLGNTRSLEGAFVSPAFGVWSDRVWLGWLGRRRPFILVGGLASAVLLALTTAISRQPLPGLLAALPPDAQRLAPAVLAIFLFTFTFNTMDDIHKALLVDVTDPTERNAWSAWSVVTVMVGYVVLLLLGFVLWPASVTDLAFAVAGALTAGSVLVTVAGVREPPPAEWAASHDAADAGGLWARVVLLARYRGALAFCLVSFAYWSGVNAVLPLVSIYTRDILGATVGEAQLLPALLLVSTTLFALPTAWLGQRLGRRRVLAAGYAIVAVAALGALVITTKEQGAAIFLLAGVGNAASNVLAIPLLAELVPRQYIGAASGLLAASGSLAAPLASLVAGALSDVYG